MEVIQAYRITRDFILDCSHIKVSLDKQVCNHIARLKLRRRGCRSGNHVRTRLSSGVRSATISVREGEIPTVITRRTVPTNSHVIYCGRRDMCTSVIKPVRRCRPLSNDRIGTTSSNPQNPPSLYVLNAAALSKPHAVEHLAADLIGSNIEIAIITETHFKAKHTNSMVDIPGYTIFRRDRAKRRGGGVAMYVLTSMQTSIWRPSMEDDTY
jgi:hypothetical protein